ncbi:MAG: alpha/beta hydrolase [Pseudomonadota bacterium]
MPASTFRCATCFAVAFVCAGLAAATAAETPAASERDAAGGRVAVPAADLRVQHDVAYGAAPAQRFDVYAPARAQAAPVIFLVHGGGWRIGDKGHANLVANKVARWVPAGWVLISTNYRMLPEADPLEQARDVARALAAAQGSAARWGADPQRFVLMGHSAGAHLVALVNGAPGFAAEFGARPVLGAVLLDSAALDVVSLMSSPHASLYDRAFGADPDFWRRVSPYHVLARGASPVLAVCSTVRRDDSCAQARAYVARAQSLGVRASVLPQALSHAQINRLLGLESAYTRAVERFLASLDPAIAALLERTP